MIMVDRIVDHVLTWSQLVVALGAAVVAVGYGIKRMYKMARNVEKLLEGIERNHLDATAALKELNTIKAQLLPNGGSSLADKINRIEARVYSLEHPIMRQAKDEHAA